MLARDFGFGDAQGHPVLELVAETVRAAQLIERCSRPDTRRQRLIEQPAIHENVHGRLGRGDLHGVEQVVPLARHFGKDRIQVCGAIAAQQFARLLPIFRLAQKKHDFRACAGAQFNQKFAAPRKDRDLLPRFRKAGRLAPARPDAQASRCGQEILFGRR